MKRPRASLRLDHLEDRTVPTAFGSPWPDASSLDLSFAPDKTKNGTVDSSLFKTLNAVAPTAVWQKEVLRAFQTWAVNANINVGLTGDGGLAFGTPGDIQGDTRFGDIRLGGIPQSGAVAANTTPFNWGTGTWSGDVIVNTATKYAINPASTAAGTDLYTVMLQEAGHVFGLFNSDDPASAMYETYGGVRVAPSAVDIATLQGFYGVRPADAFEGATGNGTLATAAPVTADSKGTIVLSGDIHDAADVDTYSWTNGSDTGSATFQLKTSGLSLLTARLSLLDAAGNVFYATAAGDPTKGDLTVKVDGVYPNTKYFVQVSGATGDVFGVGKYQLSLVRGKTTLTTADSFVKDGAKNETAATATVLTPDQNGVAFTGNAFAYNGVLESKTDLDHYRVQSPTATDGTDVAMIVRVYALQTGRAAPALTVSDAAGQALQTRVLASDGQTQTVQVLGIGRGANYTLRLANAAGADSTGNYRLTVNFQPPDATVLTRIESGQVGGTAGPQGGTLVIGDSRLFQFSFFSGAVAGAAAAPLSMTIKDATGAVVFALSQSAGQPMATGAVYLNPGSYTVTVTAGGSNPALTNYWLYAAVVSDPTGTLPTDIGAMGDPGAGMQMTAPPPGVMPVYFSAALLPPIGYFYSF